jgi:hypothetical protein
VTFKGAGHASNFVQIRHLLRIKLSWKFRKKILNIYNGSGAHPASYPIGTRGSFPQDKVAGG